MNANASNPWYVEVGGQAYGPYSLAQMHGFITEGRVIADSHIARDIRGPFAYAAGFPAFAPMLAPASAVAQMQTQAQAQNHAAPAPAKAAQTRKALQPVTRPGHAPAADNTAQKYQPVQAVETQPRVYVVMAEIQSGSAMRFLQALQNFGRAQRVGDTVWVLRSETSAQDLQSGLSQTLTRQDRLFISATSAEQSSWFNLGADMDSRIRALWGK